MDPKTLRALVKEAKQRLSEAEGCFEEYDRESDLRDIEHWAATEEWLLIKLRLCEGG
jgi:hypothetical protein